MSIDSNTERSRKFRSMTHNRYWWYRLEDSDYLPPIFGGLSEGEWSLMEEWFIETEEKFPSPGEISIPGISLISGIIGGNGISRIVQCGHYVGYSTMILGFLLRAMRKENALFSIDIDTSSTKFTQSWIDRANLSMQLHLELGSSSDPAMVIRAKEYLRGAPQIVFIDSSHQYSHTLEELDLWWDALAPGGLIFLHDVSEYAKAFDTTGKGGVATAAREWSSKHGRSLFMLNSFSKLGDNPNVYAYRDGCGMGIIQKPI